jgi:hypothetical protein
MLFPFKGLSFVFQTNVGQAVSPENLNVWLVVAGLLIIFFCLLTVFVPRIKEFITKPQEISLSKLGVSMKISILTVFILMGFILSLSSFILQWQGYAKQAKESAQMIAALKAQLDDKENEARRSRKFDISVLVKLEGNNTVLKTDDWSCEYRVELPNGEPDKAVPTTLARYGNGQTLRVFLRDISADTKVYDIRLFHKTDKKEWIVPTFVPLRDGEYLASKEEG